MEVYFLFQRNARKYRGGGGGGQQKTPTPTDEYIKHS